MISRFLAKVVISIVVVGIVAFELGSPLITRFQLDGATHDAADDAAFSLFQTRDPRQSRATAEQVLANRGVTFKDFAIDTTGTIHVTGGREAPSILLKRWDKLKSWYDVQVSATARRDS